MSAPPPSAGSGSVENDLRELTDAGIGVLDVGVGDGDGASAPPGVPLSETTMYSSGRPVLPGEGSSGPVLPRVHCSSTPADKNRVEVVNSELHTPNGSPGFLTHAAAAFGSSQPKSLSDGEKDGNSCVGVASAQDKACAKTSSNSCTEASEGSKEAVNTESAAVARLRDSDEVILCGGEAAFLPTKEGDIEPVAENNGKGQILSCHALIGIEEASERIASEDSEMSSLHEESRGRPAPFSTRPGAFRVPGAAVEEGGLSGLRDFSSNSIGEQRPGQQPNASSRATEDFAVTSAEVVPDEEDSDRYEDEINEEVQQRVQEQLDAMVTASVVTPLRDELRETGAGHEVVELDQKRTARIECVKGGKGRTFFIAALLALVVGAVLGGIFGSRAAEDPTPTTMPTQSPTAQTLEDQLHELVGNKMFEVGTPYEKAKNWIVEKSGFLVLGRNKTLIDQLYLLVLFYFSTDAGGWEYCGAVHYSEENYCEAEQYDTVSGTYIFSNGSRWLGDTKECGWFGVTCSSEAFVTSIVLFHNELIGTLPPELARLPHLEGLNLGSNDLSGTVPTEFSSMESLRYLELHSNELNGTIPGELYNASRLCTLSLGQNDLVGTISTMIGHLIKLTELFLMDMSLSGTIPTEVGLLRELALFDVSWNSLNGSIPSEMYGLPLVEFYAGGNDFSGTISPLIGNLTALEKFSIGGNNFGSTLPSEIGLITTMKALTIRGNDINGSVPEEFYDMVNLEWLDCSSNLLTGTISRRIGNMIALDMLDISQNNFFGGVPSEIGRLKNLTWLMFYINDISGPLPDGLYNLKKLQKLVCAENRMNGTLSPLVRNLASLEQLIIPHNEFTGSIPSELPLTNLRWLLLLNNKFTGVIPSELAGLPDYTTVDLRNNSFTGTVTDDFCTNFCHAFSDFSADCMVVNGTPPSTTSDCCTECCSNETKIVECILS